MGAGVRTIADIARAEVGVGLARSAGGTSGACRRAARARRPVRGAVVARFAGLDRAVAADVVEKAYEQEVFVVPVVRDTGSDEPAVRLLHQGVGVVVGRWNTRGDLA